MGAMRSVKFKLALEDVREEDGRYTATIRLKVSGEDRLIRLEKLAHRPYEAWARLEEGVLTIDLIGPGGEGYASCIIHLENLEKRNCRSLLLPPSE